MVVMGDANGLAALAIAAEHVDAGVIASMSRHAGGWIFVSLTPQRCEELGLVRAGYKRVSDGSLTRTERKVTATVSAVESVGIRGTAADQAHTIRTLADPEFDRRAIVSPGRVQPVCVYEAGVRDYPGRAEAAVDLARLAGLAPAAVVCDIIDDNGAPAPPEQVRELARALGLLTVSVAEVLDQRRFHETVVERVVTAPLPTSFGDFMVVGYRSLFDDTEHLAMVTGDVEGARDVLVHLHTRCLTGDVFHSLRCDCGDQLDAALAAIDREGRGVLVYRARDVRDADVDETLRQYAQLEAGSRVLDPSHVVFEPGEYEPAAAIIKDLRVDSVRLVTSDLREVNCLERYGVRARAVAI